MEITKGEHAALALIVHSGRAVVEVGFVTTLGSDGRISASGYHSAIRGGFAGHFALLDPAEAEPMDAATAAGLECRGLVKTWPIGLVSLIDRDRRVIGARAVVLATLTPLAAAWLGVRLVECPDGGLRWTGSPGAADPAEVAPPIYLPYPEPFAEIAPLPKPKARRREKRAG